MNPEVSIVIINYNKVNLTIDCIDSIYQKTKGVNFEIILVDNASTEGDVKIAKEKFPCVDFIMSKENLGFAKGNNLGIAQAKADTILLLNNDTVLINDAISLAYKKLKAQPEAGVVAAQLQYPDGRIQHNASSLPSLKKILLALFRIDRFISKQKRARMYLGFLFDHRYEVIAEWIWGAFFMIKKEVIEKLPEKKMPDDLFMYSEDIEWGYAVKQTGYKIIFFPEAKLIHYVGQSNYSKTAQAIKKNTKYIIAKYRGKLFATIYLFFYKLYHVSMGIEYRLTGKKMNTQQD